ncbi:epidermal growth factor receptor substrate 15-like 1 isoform X2 [Oscarella lobularis]|uniref:epidermal growth factor receptor substrate 15-like 1 isoform X2 n=1 Tax=Oscarella lobularis TaxID=121494 RepID=UPI003313164E
MANFPPLAQVAGTQVGIYESLWRQADPTNKGRVDGATGAAVLKKSKLKESVLHKIWNLADPTASGSVDKQGFFVALKLIALAQNGKDISLGNLTSLVPPPELRASVSPSLPRKISTSSNWAVTVAEKQKYDSIFLSLNPLNGKLGGDAVKPVMMNSKLPFNLLSKIWEISDIDGDGQMDSDEFSVAMHLIYQALEGNSVPQVLPPNLYPPSRRSRAKTSSVSPPPPLPPPSFATMPSSSPALRKSNSPADAWVVTPAEKIKYDELFGQNKSSDGFLTGENARKIFMKSGLSTALLARVWEMCDIDKRGRLTADQFALAMHIIEEKLKGVEIPTSLTASMIPPSSSSSLKEDAKVGADVSMMKDLDALGKDLEHLGREKATLLEEVKRTEEAVQVKTQEVKTSQAELDQSQSDLRDLEKRKGEAKSRLDQLDEERAKFEGLIAEVKQKCKDEEDQIARLKAQFANQEMQSKSQKEDLARSREELKKLQSEEKELQDQIASGKQQLDDVKKQIQANQTEMSQVRTRLADLHSTQRSITASLAQHSSSLPIQVLTAADAGDDVMSARATAGSSPVSTLSGFSMSSGPDKPLEPEPADDFKEDPFKSNSNADPFGGGSEDPFKADPFTNKSDPFSGSDPFKNADPFKENDPFKSPTTNFPPANASDPFGGVDPFGSASSFGAKASAASASNTSNPFAVSSNTLSPPSLPPKRSATVGHKPTTTSSSPFGGGTSSGTAAAFGGGFADFDSFASTSKQSTEKRETGTAEDDLVAWAKRQSLREESARQKRESAEMSSTS